MKKKIATALMAFAIAFGGTTIFAQQPQSEEDQIAALIAAMPVKPGSPAPNFTLKDINGKDVSLSSYAGQWVVLDFWGSWCRYCVQGIPAMKDAYNKYHSRGFEIIGIDCNEPEDTWKAAVEKYELPWINVFNPVPREKRLEEGVGAAYGVQAYPTKILIDPEGKVYSIFLGEDPAFYTLLEEIYK